MSKLTLKDLLIYGEDGVYLLDELRDIITRKKESVLDNAIKEFKPEELVLVNPFGEEIHPSKAEEILDTLKGIPSVKIFPHIDVYDCIILPENIEILNEMDNSWEFSSSPVNNVPKVLVDEKEISELDVTPIWVLEISPDDLTPVSTVESFVKNMNGGMLVAILYTYLISAEEEAIISFVEGTGGFVINLSKKLIEPKDNVETEFMKRMRSRVGKYLGMKALRGEIL